MAAWELQGTHPYPYLSADLPGLGGRIKARPEHFEVEEIPLYEPAGDGPHLYLTLRRQGLTTRQVVEDLARRFGRPAADIGYAGLKDKEAVTTQTFSLAVDLTDCQARAKCADGPWEVVGISRHRNKLKVGHLLGNRFTIVLSEPRGSLADGLAIAERLKNLGVPNYFGEQRFGREADNHQVGLDLLKGGRGGRNWRDKFLLSAVQSFIYNHYLARRIEDGLFLTVLTGDVCKKYQTGGLFISEDGVLETARFQNWELSHTGPIFGAKMMRAQGPAGELEARVLAGLGLSGEEAARAGAGDRRANRLEAPDLVLRPDDEGFRLTFALPKGAYATSLMREFLRPPQ